MRGEEGEREGGLSCACQKTNHSSGSVEMVEEIGMRVGGPSESRERERGMRCEGRRGGCVSGGEGENR